MQQVILLIKTNENENTRMYLMYESDEDAVEGICKLYEQCITNPSKLYIGYRIRSLLKFIDSLYDIAYLKYEQTQNGFVTHGRAWVKSLIVMKKAFTK